MLSKAVGKYGASQEEFSAMAPRVKQIHKHIIKQYKDGGFGFAHLLADTKAIAQVEAVAKEVRQQFDTLLVIGIGGSDLGARALYTALGRPDNGMRVYFLGSTCDPEELQAVLAHIDLSRTAINIVSKSGGTIEPMATFLYVREQLIKAVGFKHHGAHIIATTDPTSGVLKTLMDAEGHRILSIPPQIGGRFSLLSPVGLFPAACAGINIKKLFDGAHEANTLALKHASVKKNDMLAFAVLSYLALKRRKQNITVMMPYSTALKDISAWFAQLWAESLGKATDRANRKVNTGQTPTVALGPTDQHSQLQLWNEGPYDKIITFITVEKFRTEVTLPKDLSFVPDLSYLAKKKMSSIMHAEYTATMQSLTNHNRPNGTITLTNISEQSLGALFMFFEWATVFMGEFLNINAFNQPGVEESKVLVKKKLN